MFKFSAADRAPPQASLPKSSAEKATDLAFRQGDTEASLLACLVAVAHGVTVQELFHHSRSRAPIAATRQLAMYLMHVALGRTLTEVGNFFGRDRTTVSYACALVEDQREQRAFDVEVEELETRLAAVLDPTHKISSDTGASNDE